MNIIFLFEEFRSAYLGHTSHRNTCVCVFFSCQNGFEVKLSQKNTLICFLESHSWRKLIVIDWSHTVYSFISAKARAYAQPIWLCETKWVPMRHADCLLVDVVMLLFLNPSWVLEPLLLKHHPESYFRNPINKSRTTQALWYAKNQAL